MYKPIFIPKICRGRRTVISLIYLHVSF